jgi:DNA primase
VIPESEVERLRESADIVAVIGEYVNLKRAGADFRGPCPFHQGAHRNFSVSPRKRMYYCFVCHESGDVFTFVQKRLGLDWPGALRHVAAKSGVELHEQQGRAEGPDPRTPLWEASAAAAQYFQRMLWDPQTGRVAREYLAERSVSRELAEQFGLGFAPREIGLMRLHLHSLGIDDARQLEAGLLVRHADTDEPRPRFRQRLIFPIQDQSGRSVGFGGRLIGPGEPKYLNTGETGVFAKGTLLYHLNVAKLAARRDERMFVVEGYFDALRLASVGVESVVAPLGTALTEAQAQLIKRYTSQVFLLYDSDKAGLKATFRAGDRLLAQGLNVRVISLPTGDDPDTFALREGRHGIERAAGEAVDVFERKIQILQRGGWFADLHKRRKAIDHLLPTVRAAADPLMREMYIARAAEVSGVDRQVLAREAALSPGRRDRASEEPPPEWPSSPAPSRPPARRASPRGPASSAERELVRAMLSDRSVAERVTERFGPDSFRELAYREIFERLLEVGAEAGMEEVAAGLGPGTVATMQELLEAPDAIQHLAKTVEDSLSRLEERRLADRNREIDAELKVARADEQDRLLTEKTGNTQEIARLRQSRERP